MMREADTSTNPTLAFGPTPLLGDNFFFSRTIPRRPSEPVMPHHSFVLGEGEMDVKGRGRGKEWDEEKKG